MGLDRAIMRLRGAALVALLAVPMSVGMAGVAAAQPQPQPQLTALLPVSIADIAAPLMDAVVNISTTQTLALDQTTDLPGDFPFENLFGDNGEPLQQVQGMGSGYVTDASGIIVTNNHVIDGADEIWAIFHDGSRLRATIVGIDPDTDIAVLRVEPPRPLVAVSFGDSEAVRIGDWVLAIGNPFGLGGTVTLGILSARNRDLRAGPFDDYLQTDAAINQGNSGGPLFNLAGEVIGMNTAILSPSGQSSGVAFAVPSSMISRVVGHITEFGEVRRGRIGVRIQEVTDGIAEGFGIGQPRGALVVQVFEDTPAEEIGLQTGDIVVNIDGHQIVEMRDLPLVVAGLDVGATVPITFLRGGEELTLEVTIQGVETAPDTVVGAPAPAAEPEPDTRILTAADLGFTLEPLSPALRREFDIADFVNIGMVITAVTPGSLAAERGIQPGEVILEVGTDPLAPAVITEAQVDERLAAEQETGRNVVLLLLSDPTGTTRFEWVRVGG